MYVQYSCNSILGIPDYNPLLILLHIPTDIGKVTFTFLKLKENGSNGPQKVIGEVFVLAAGVNFAQFAK
jgi:hypothetical protein